jgi:rubrerythrin
MGEPMSVLSNRKSESRRRGRSARRSRHSTHAEPVAPAREAEDLADERRLRESGGPHDRAMYTCSCGYVFEADVTTSVACPNCGTAQAW